MRQMKRGALWLCLALALSLLFSFAVVSAHECEAHAPFAHDCIGVDCFCHTAVHTCAVCTQLGGLLRLLSLLVLACTVYALVRFVAARAFSRCRETAWEARTPVAWRCKLTN